MTVPLLAGLAPLAGRYQAYIIDLWGCAHDGTRPFPGVPDCLARLRGDGKTVLLLSNAPRRIAVAAARLEEIGLQAALYDHLMTSGEETWQALRDRSDPFHAGLGRRCYYVGYPRDRQIMDGLDLDDVDDLDTADFLLVTGPNDPRDEVAAYEDLLAAARERDLPLVCANPDVVVLHRGRRQICAGALARRYAVLGGTVRQHGKPYRSIYATCFALTGVAPARTLALGDSLSTDMAGARDAGIDAALVVGGIHAEDFAPNGAPDATLIAAACRDAGVNPVAALPELRW
jgi:HAD superfamily hydrolase (TIGR01459 family)